ncbi:NADPH-dependent glutamate synthase [Fusibacter ferrireducens]|uniref:NADPH-dependent glutamate synthase n=1 Tax=Fusibacter ferrireducens TaxID=2785058 RepID=A0ABR9ZS56_9FIRM|nr:NADPH-dependent glutamate synthase [Fusibacter ferrireducens]MBF4692464.1 NADPH-dependent glutamate synthase [Fusibacter ferrireducens]
MSNNIQRTHMKLKDPRERITNFQEVALGYTLEEAKLEASRCLECKNKPCVAGCPVGIDIPKFIHEIKASDIDKAFEALSEYTSLPAICGRVCPQETQCEALCVRGIKGEPVAIGALERFVADNHNNVLEVVPQESKGIKTAIIGSGPAGLSCAGTLAKLGYDVTIFEALHDTGGVLRYGIPEFRLPKEIVDREVNALKTLGVKIEKNVVIGRSLDLKDLEDDGFKAIFIGTGAGLPRFMNIKGENLLGVYSANEFLTRVNLMKAYEAKSDTPLYLGRNVAVVGGGNVAMDAARSAKRLGVENVYLIYRRSEEEMPARREEVEHAKEEAIEFKFLCNPLEIIGNEQQYVSGIKCIQMELGEPDANGRRRPHEVEGSEHLIEVDNVIMSIGTLANPLIKTLGIDINNRGLIETNESGRTSNMAVYAGGDAVSGAATVINAMGAGKQCAYEIHKDFMSKREL